MITLHVLGVRMSIAAEPEDLAAAFRTVFGAFTREDAERPVSREVRVKIDGEAGRYEDGSRTVRLISGPWRRAQVYNLLYTSLVRSLDRVYLLHAAAVARDGRALLVGGPSGSGKSSLGLALVRRGFSMLSDDIAPLTRADGRIHPFPRRLGFLLDSPAGRAAGDKLVLGDKAFIAAEELGLPSAEEPLPPGAVVLMNPFDPTGRTVEMTIWFRGEPDKLPAGLAVHPGIRPREPRQTDGMWILQAEVEGGEAVAAMERAIESAGDDILFHSRGYGKHKSYAERPALEPISVQEASVGLLREMLNRERGSALMESLQGRLTGALSELCSLLAKTPCLQLTPADIDSTADLVAATFRRLGAD